jgi:hypothetical protein
MNFPSAIILPFAILAPIFIFIIVATLKVRRRNRQQELEGEVPPSPFEPAPEPPPGIFLRRFTPAQRSYLREQRAIARIGGLYAAWIFFLLFSSGLSPEFIDQYGGDQSLPQRVWFSYLFHFGMAGGLCFMATLLASFVALSNLVSTPEASFIRTRPLTIRFLFWARAGSALGTLLAALITASACSFLLLLALHGPVWKHLLDNPNPVSVALGASAQHSDTRIVFLSKQGHIQAMHLVASLRTSPLRLLLSAITTMLLTFSFVSVVITLPIRSQRIKLLMGIFIWCFWIVYEAFGVVGGFISPRLASPGLARILFSYSNPGPPPPYAFALVPLLLATVFLCLAQFQTSRLEP